MAIEVLSPSYEGGSAEAVAYAPRRTFAAGDALHLVLIENGKPKAKQLLQFVAEEVQKRLPVATIETHSKPSAGRPIDADIAKMFAARAHLVISGLGD
jgi:hypothetical protein